MPNFYITTNAEQFQRAIQSKNENLQREVKKEVKKLADDCLVALYGNLDKSTSPPYSFTAVRTVGGQKTWPITVTRGTVRKSLTKGGADNIFEVQEYRAKVGSRNKVLVKYLEEGTPFHGAGKLMRFALPAGVVFTRKGVKGIRPMRIFKKTAMMFQRAVPTRIYEAVRRGLGI